MNTILVIEDEQKLLESLETMLQTFGFKTISSINGRNGLELLSQNYEDISLILCDINLPDIDGYEVLGEAKSSKLFYKIPFVFLSAYADEKDIRAGMDLGADDYLTKPFTAKQLIKTITARIRIQTEVKEKVESEINEKILSIINKGFRQEFFSPVNSLLNVVYLQTAEEIAIDPKLLRENMNSIFSASFRIYRNSRNIVLYSMLMTSKTLQTDKRLYHTNVKETLNEVLTYFSFGGAKDNLPINCILENVSSLNYSGEYLNVIFSELIDNAIKFNESDTPPFAKLVSTSDGFSFSITNYNSNAASVSISNIAPFNKLHNNTSHVGMGLGLYICKCLCQQLRYSFKIITTDKKITITVGS